MRSAGKARDCLRFSLLLGEQVARDCFSTQNKAMGELSSVLIEKCSVFNSHKFRRSFKPRQKDFSVRTCLVQNPQHLRSMDGWCVHKETRFITNSTFSSKQLNFSSKLENHSRHSSLNSHSWVLSSLISSSCFSKALCKFCMH